jgi:hypothetical protein
MKLTTKVMVIPLMALLSLMACQTPVSPVSPPTINSFTFSPTSLPVGGGNVVLEWNTSGDTARWIDNGIGNANGFSSKTVQVTSTTTFTLLVTNSSGVVVKQSVVVAVPERTATPTGFMRFMNSSSNAVTEVKMDLKTLYPGNITYPEPTNYIKISSGSHNFSVETDVYDSQTSLYVKKITPLGIVDVIPNAKYTLFNYETDLENSDAIIVKAVANSINDIHPRKVRFVNTFRESFKKNGVIKIYLSYIDCINDVNIFKSIPLTYKSVSDYFPIDVTDVFYFITDNALNPLTIGENDRKTYCKDTQFTLPDANGMYLIFDRSYTGFYVLMEN